MQILNLLLKFLDTKKDKYSIGRVCNHCKPCAQQLSCCSLYNVDGPLRENSKGWEKVTLCTETSNYITLKSNNAIGRLF